MPNGDYIPTNQAPRPTYAETAALEAVLDGNIGEAERILNGFTANELAGLGKQLNELMDLAHWAYVDKRIAEAKQTEGDTPC